MSGVVIILITLLIFFTYDLSLTAAPHMMTRTIKTGLKCDHQCSCMLMVDIALWLYYQSSRQYSITKYPIFLDNFLYMIHRVLVSETHYFYGRHGIFFIKCSLASFSNVKVRFLVSTSMPKLPAESPILVYFVYICRIPISSHSSRRHVCLQDTCCCMDSKVPGCLLHQPQTSH